MTLTTPLNDKQENIITFSDKRDNLIFTYVDRLPSNMTSTIFALYKESIVECYKKHALEKDIEQFKLNYSQQYNDPIYTFAVEAAFDAIKKWRTERMKAYIAYKTTKTTSKIVGFIVFTEYVNKDDPFIYIAQLGVEASYQTTGVGERLQKCVYTHYPMGSKFKIVTRHFNKVLYEKKYKMTLTDNSQVKELGYDDNYYCALEHVTSPEEIKDYKTNLVRAYL